jgi:hypothetical protein
MTVIVVAMDKLKGELYLLYSEELLKLNLGYELDIKVLKKMKDIIGEIIILNSYKI